MKATRFVLCGIILLSVATLRAQTESNLTFEQLQTIAAASAQQNPETGSRLVPEMLQFFREEEIKYTGGDKYKDATLKFRLHTPEPIEDGKTYPLVLWLHGVGEAGDDNKEQLGHLHHIITYLTGPKKRDFFLLVPQTPEEHRGWDTYSSYKYEQVVESIELPTPIMVNSGGGGIIGSVQRFFGFGGQTQVQVINTDTRITQRLVGEIEEPFGDSPLGFSLAMLEQVCKKYPVDRDRITVSGLSSGGDGTWRALERAPEIFAAAVPLVSWSALKDAAIVKSPIIKKIPIWAIYSSDDAGIEHARADFARVEAAGCNVKKSEFGLCQHNAWTPAMLQADIFSWLLSRAKKDGEYIAVEDASVDPSEMQGIVEVAVRDSRLPTLALPQASENKPAVPSVVLESRPAPEFVPLQASSSVTVPSIPAIPQTHADKETVDLCVNALLLYFQLGDASFGENGLFGIFNRLPLEAKRDFLVRAIEIMAVGYASFEEERRATLRAAITAVDNAKDYTDFIILYSNMINKCESRARRQAEVLVYLSTFLLPQPQIFTEQPQSPPAQPPREAQPFSMPIIIQEEEEELDTPSQEPIASVTGKRKVEDCDKEWEMSTATLYGLYPADWTAETATLPEFVRKLSAAELGEHLRQSFAGDGKDAKAVCEHILRLDNRPLSSPWFTTSGGRLKDDVRYALSPKGEALAHALKKELQRETLNATQQMVEKTLRKLGEIVKPVD